MSSLTTNSQKHKSTLNLGILAHIDAGKTSLTERLLFDNGATSKLGSVDTGTTQTDTNEIEKERGITIRSAVVPFLINDLQVNIVDTPGHPDFIAEVERALSILDGAILVVSAVEGIQAQTRVLMRSLKKLNIPTLIFVNKIDRMGAQTDDLIEEIKQKLHIQIIPMNSVLDAGTHSARIIQRQYDNTAEILAENDEDLLKKLVDGLSSSPDELQTILEKQVAKALVYPLYFGSAKTGLGISELTNSIKTLLPSNGNHISTSELQGTVFAIERSAKGEKVAYIRLFSGELRERQEVTFSRLEEAGRITEYSGKITNLEIIGEHLNGQINQQLHSVKILTAGSIAKIKGIPEIHVADHVGEWDSISSEPNFSSPSLTVVVKPKLAGQETELSSALKNLADEDPLIQSKVLVNSGISILLYGAVQKEVIAERLKRDFGIETIFEDIKPIYFERPIAKGEYLREFDPHDKNEQYWATIGLRIEPAELGTGIRFIREAKWGLMPPAFYRAIKETVFQTLQQGLYGWAITDCIITLTQVGYNEPSSVAADFRNLTPIVLMKALKIAGTQVYEPYNDVEIEVPPNCVNDTIGYITQLGGEITRSLSIGTIWHLHADLPVRLVQDFTTSLPGLSQGKGIVVLYPRVSRHVRGEIPIQEKL